MGKTVIVIKEVIDADGSDATVVDTLVTGDHFVIVEGGCLAVRDANKNNVKVYANGTWKEAQFG